MLELLFSRFTCSLYFFVLALMLTSSAEANDTTETCAVFLKAQDYVRAENEAQNLLKHKNLKQDDMLGTYACLGTAYLATGRSRDAISVFHEVEKLATKTADLAIAYFMQGGAYLNLNDLDKAELYAQRALKSYRELEDKNKEAAALNILGLIAQQRGDMDRALLQLEEALTLESDDTKKPALLKNLALIHADQGEFNKATEEMNRALNIAKRNGNGHLVAILEISLGRVFYQNSQLDEAENALTTGLNAIHLIGDKHWEAFAYANLAYVEEARDNLNLALQWYKKSEDLYRAIGNVNRAEQIHNESKTAGK
jgi:tetratricopeptide (TPR) repeat protein